MNITKPYPPLIWNSPLVPMEIIDGIAIHHSVGNMNIFDMHDMHIKEREWKGIAYAYYILKDGTIMEGRGFMEGGGLPDGFNDNILSICFQGNFMEEYPTQLQYRSGVELIKWIISLYPSITKIAGHKDFSSTVCPGYNFPLNEMINAVMKGGNSMLLKKGSQGQSVVDLQNKLNILGYGLVADGEFGGLTDKAVKQFQSEMSLVADGIVGSVTMDKLNDVIKQITPTSQPKEVDYKYMYNELQNNLKKVRDMLDGLIK